MVGLRGRRDADKLEALRRTYRSLRAKRPAERAQIARAYTLMLELMNACENAYRTRALASRGTRDSAAPSVPKGFPEAIVYVLTAHPTESRAPQNIAIFREIQRTLVEALDSPAFGARAELPPESATRLRHALDLAWEGDIVRDRKPKVRHEAEHVYSTLLQDEILEALLETSRREVPVYVRSWVGGDKDGHPGVDERATRESLALSRAHIARFAAARLAQARETLALLPRTDKLERELAEAKRRLSALRRLRDGDAARVVAFRRAVDRVDARYREFVGAPHPAIERVRQLLHAFPGLVVPLELRESSDVLMSHRPADGKLAIDRMLRAIARLSRGGDPRWYARGFIVSMTESAEHLLVASLKVRAAFRGDRLPVIPLFENREALSHSERIAADALRDPVLGRIVRARPNRAFEFMLGYSDSAKENGVLASRLAIAETMHKLDALCRREKLKPVFFHGSGGSVDRGGGSIADQTAWWTRSALALYKVTVQGEMIERSLASPAIARGQIGRILESARRGGERQARAPRDAALDAFAERIAATYRETIARPDFLRLVETSTPYSRLDRLRIGSRPTKRQAQLSVPGLRAIPWVLCWTQTRVLFPTWWGVGRAWRESSASERRALRRAARREPVFASYLKALGFTLAKVELATWRLYLDRSGLSADEQTKAFGAFVREYREAQVAVREITGQRDPLWFRPWLGASIRLRAPLIHPLNLLQVLALEDDDSALLRTSTTGIASGMLTTG